MKKAVFVSILFTVALALLPMQARDKGPAWLDQAIFYQIYPSSFADSDGNGIGDIQGIIDHLDYIKSLGVNALWLNPVFESGWFDGGYDVIDYYKVDPRFGTNSDLVRLLDEAHSRGIKVCLDLVAGHSSDKCEWFKSSANGDKNDHYADYYIWTDEISEKDKEDIARRKASPNPASSVIGKYVELNAKRGKYYVKNFFECQPALNYGYANPDPNHPWEQSVDAPGPQAVRREIRNIMAFWFDKGVDGFRVDMAQSLVKNDPGKVEISKLWNEMRNWKDEKYPECVLISEWSDPAVSIPAGFNVDFMIHFGIKGYPSLFFAPGTPGGMRRNAPCYFSADGRGSLDEFVENYTSAYSATKDLGYIAIPSANHDFQRPNAGDRNTPEQLKVAMTFFMTMPGVPFIYYGDEIGMKYIPGLPSKEGSNQRAGTRTPMQWAPGETAGFSTCAPQNLYLPVDTEGGKITVASEEADPSSMLNYTRTLVALRKANAGLGNSASWKLLNPQGVEYPFVYERSGAGQTFIIALNPKAAKVKVTIPSEGSLSQTLVSGKAVVKHSSKNNSDTITMNPFTAVIFRVSNFR